MGQRIGVEVAVFDGEVGGGVLPAGHDGRGQFASDRIGAKGTGIQMQELHDGPLMERSAGCRLGDQGRSLL